jgi:hypothetical protein
MRGSRNKATLLAEAMLEGEAPALTRSVLDRALEGNPTAMRLCFERLVAPRRERPVQIDLPAVAGPEDVAPAMAAVVRAVGSGAISPSEGGELALMVETLMRALDRSDFDRRLRLLEELGHVPRV